LIKNFSNAKVVLVITIPALEAQSGMIDYTFLLPGKNDLHKPRFSRSLAATGKPSGLITSVQRQHPRKGSAPGSNNRLKEAPEKRFSGASFNVAYPEVKLKFLGLWPSIFSLPYFFRISSISLGLVFKHFSSLGR
jgi:hypothetical protein